MTGKPRKHGFAKIGEENSETSVSWTSDVDMHVLRSLAARDCKWVPEDELFKQAYGLWNRGYIDGRVQWDKYGFEVTQWRINKKGRDLLEKSRRFRVYDRPCD